MTLIPKCYRSAIVAIGISKKDSPAKTFESLGTGFLYGKLNKKVDGGGSYHVFLVTNRHVIEGALGDKKSISIKFTQDGGHKDIDIELFDKDNSCNYHFHDNDKIDVAIVPINIEEKVDARGLPDPFVFRNDIDVLTYKKMINLGVAEGSSIFTCGFPLEFLDKDFVIVRSGIIARIQDCYKEITNTFLIDSLIFPGNSGSAVILNATFSETDEAKQIKIPKLIGIVTGYIPYHERAISEYTGNPRIIFEENSGLGTVVPVDYIDETIEQAKKIYGKKDNS